MAGALGSALDHDLADPAIQKFLDRRGFVVRLGEEIDLLARRQERSVPASTSSMDSRKPGVSRISGRMLGSKLNVPPRAVMRATASRATCERPGAENAVPMTCMWSQLSMRASASGVRVSFPVALWAML